MKPGINFIGVAVGLTGWLLWAQAGWSFYNPQTGRWLNRDPIGEEAGLNLAVLLNNAPIDGYDLLGRSPPLVATDLGRRDPMGDTNGMTFLKSWVISTVLDPCSGWCRYEVRIRACWASAEYWWSDDQAREHERQHIAIWSTHWDSATETARRFTGQCVSRQKAVCYQAAIQEYSRGLRQEGWASQFELDCSLQLDPNHPFCVQADIERALANDYMQDAWATELECATRP